MHPVIRVEVSAFTVALHGLGRTLGIPKLGREDTSIGESKVHVLETFSFLLTVPQGLH